jgi:hypothetical protein
MTTMQKTLQKSNKEFKQNYRINNSKPARITASLAVVL